MTEKKQPKGLKTKDRVVKCAAELMAKKGVGAASLSDIAEAAGIRKPSLYNHFESREELEVAVFLHVDALLSKADLLPDDIDAIVGKYSAAAVIKAVVHRFIKAFTVPPALYAYTIIESEKFFNKRVAEIRKGVQLRLSAQCSYLIETLCKAGKLVVSDSEMAIDMLCWGITQLLAECIVSEDLDEVGITKFAEKFSLLYAAR